MNKALITEKIEKIEKYFLDTFKPLGQSFLNFDESEAISKQLTALIKRE